MTLVFGRPWVRVQFFAMPLGDNVPDIHMQNRDMPADDRENGLVRWPVAEVTAT
jgi:hypothetical protein